MDVSPDEVRRGIKEMKVINKYQERRVHYLEMRVTLLVVSFLFFQTTMLLSISHTSSTLHEIRWIPFCLSLLVSVLFWLPFFGTTTRWVKTQYQYDLSLLDLQALHRHMHDIESQNNANESGRITVIQSTTSAGHHLQQLQKPDLFTVYQRYVCVFVAVSALLAFTVVISHSLLYGR